MKTTKITREDYTADEMWTLYKKERDGRMKERYHAVALMLEGKSPPEVARELHVSRNTIWEWAKAYNEKGLDGIQRKSPPGKKSCLTRMQKEELKKDLLKSPREFGYEFAIWNGKNISIHIKKKFNANLGHRGVQKMLKKEGYSRQKPRISYAKADPVVQEQFKVDLKKRSMK